MNRLQPLRPIAKRHGAPVPTGRHGFSLIELLVALTMLAVGILGMASVLIGTSTWQSRSDNQSELFTASQSKFEKLRTAAQTGSADTVQLSVGGSLTSNEANHADSLQTPDGSWVVRRWQVTSGPSTARTITLRVVPRGQDDRVAGERDFSTIIWIPSE